MPFLGPALATTTNAAPLRLRRGVNAWPWFSLTREYPPPRTDYGWPAFQTGRPIPSRDDLARLRAAGFDFLRLPVDPGPFLATSGAQRVTLIADLMEAVAAILAADLSVVVNVQANAATHHWTPDRLYGSAQAPHWPAYRGFIGELAGRLHATGSRRIALEPVNEPPQACGSAVWTALQDELLEAARREAPNLTLVAGGACGGMIPGLVALDPTALARFAPVLFTMHFYEPYLFSHQGAPWMREPVYRDLNSVPWPASAGSLDCTLAAVRARMDADVATSATDKAEAYTITKAKLEQYFAAQPDRRFVTHHLSAVRDWAERHGIPPHAILMGEFGALRSDARYVAAEPEDRARYVRDVREAAEAFGFGWAFWNLFDGMGLMDDVTRRLDPAIIAALGLGVPMAEPVR
ncbi:cellulase family glycosylhydrolase [Methylobacterium sp. BTF04]|uniref:glycoside hydrolase family 5 protein n=1 Tax=Methylobacterium sp. BTF04 TaxID=2708300 RepID=UPI001FF00235|nr:cellulase family glycosylhydrolase [Methylobacterium sp. BTF04]